MYVAKIFTGRAVSGDRDPIRHGRAADRRQGTGTAGGPACGCISIASITPIAWIGRAVGGLASMGFIFHIYRKALRSGRERRAERHLGGSLSRLALRVDFYRGALRTRTESRATALFGRLETAVADHEQSGLGAAEGDSQPVANFISAADKLALVGQPGVQLGLL